MVSRMGAVLVLMVAGCSGGGDGGGGEKDTAAGGCPAERDPRFDALAAVVDAEREALGAPGAAVALVLDGELVYCEGFGERHPVDGGEVTAQTLFRMGSITKMMTAAAVLQRVEAGDLSLDDHVVDVLPGFSMSLDPRHEDLLVRQLLTHEGGLYDYQEIDSDHDDGALEAAVEGWFDEGMVHISPPGAFWNYSNTGWYIAGRIAEHLSGTPYPALMEAAVFAPLDMPRTTFDNAAVLADGDYASGLTVDWTGASPGAEAIAEPDSYDNAWARPAGYAWTTAEELARFGQFLLDGDEEVLADALREEMTAAHVGLGSQGDVQSYGYGVYVSEGLPAGGSQLTPVKLVHHDGDISGFAADLYTAPEHGFALALLANTDGAHFSEALLEALEGHLDLPAPVDGPDVSVDPSTFDDLVGDYAEPWNIIGDFSVSVADDGAELEILCPTLDAYSIPYSTTLAPYTRDSFVFTVQGYSMLLTFIPDEARAVTFARARLFVGTRDDAGVSRRRPSAPPPFDPDRLARALRSAP